MYTLVTLTLLSICIVDVTFEQDTTLPFFIINENPNYFPMDESVKIANGDIFETEFVVELYVGQPGDYVNFLLDFSEDGILITESLLARISGSYNLAGAENLSWRYSSARVNMSVLPNVAIPNAEGVFGLRFPGAQIWDLFQAGTFVFNTYGDSFVYFDERAVYWQESLDDDPGPVTCFTGGGIVEDIDAGSICTTTGQIGSDDILQTQHIILLAPGHPVIQLSDILFDQLFTNTTTGELSA